MSATGPYPDLISLAQVRDQLRQVAMDDDDRLERFRIEAQDIVINYLKVPTTQFDTALPPRVQAAMLAVVQALYDDTDPLDDKITKVLWRDRDPALA